MPVIHAIHQDEIPWQRSEAKQADGRMAAVATVNDVGYDAPLYDPFWAAAERLALPVSLHVLTERKGGDIEKRPPSDTALVYFDVQRTLAQMIFGDVFVRFPKLIIVSVENDCGWAPYFVERLDYVLYKRYTGQGAPLPDTPMPSAQFRRNVRCTFMRDRSGVHGRDLIGPETLMWASDYPHSDSTWPKSQEMIDDLFAGVPDEERRQITATNVAKLYDF